MLFWSLPQANPTKFVFANIACHVIAPVISLDFSFTRRAKFNWLLFSKFFCHKTVARCAVSMPFVTALKAYLLLARWTGQLAGLQVFPLHHPIAPRSNAVSCERISFFSFFVVEFLEFRKNLRFVCEQPLSLRQSNLRGTLVVKTL
jgi:hypothetical protein